MLRTDEMLNKSVKPAADKQGKHQEGKLDSIPDFFDISLRRVHIFIL
jgi:hypothetical protein